MIKRPRQHNEKHLQFVRGLPCVVCGNNVETEAAHIRYQDRRAAKRYTGKGEKPDDAFTIPLCGAHHRDQHHVGELHFWQRQRIDPVFVALALWNASGDQERGEQIVEASRER